VCAVVGRRYALPSGAYTNDQAVNGLAGYIDAIYNIFAGDQKAFLDYTHDEVKYSVIALGYSPNGTRWCGTGGTQPCPM
jgi:hypothetical protein